MKLINTPLFFLFISATILFSCKSRTSEENVFVEANIPEEILDSSQPGFVHAVYFWLDKENTELVEEFINEGLPKLAKIPSIQSVSWGPPAGTQRAIVDNSYDLAWIVNFEDVAAHDAYQIDSVHVEFVEKYKPIFTKIQVFDNVVDGHTTN